MPEEGFLGFLGKLANAFQQSPNDAHVRVWHELRPWFGRLVQNAGPKWLPRIALGLPCDIPVYQHGHPVGRCAHSAVAACDVCHRACCLDHARIDQFGDAICLLCVAEAIRTKKGTAPAEPDAVAHRAKAVAAARRLLHLKKSSSYEDAKAAWKKASLRWHPDHNPGNPEAAEKFREIQTAWELLKQDYPNAA